MRIQLQVGACPLHDRHGSAATSDGSFDFHAAPVVATRTNKNEVTVMAAVPGRGG